MKKKQGKLYALPAGQGDCLLFQFENEAGVFKHILIDGGNRNKLEFNKLKKIILEILKEGGDGNLDLVIVTHSDDDHISGILKMLGDDQINPKIKEIWFNAEKTISSFFNTEFCKSQSYKIIKTEIGVSKSSRNQDNDLYNILENDSRWSQELISVGKEYSIDNLQIKVLSPTLEKLKILNDYWPKQNLKAKKNIQKSSAKKGFDYELTYDQYLKNTPEFEEDSTPVNGGSIALLLNWGDKKFLLLSDAHPSIVVSSLKTLVEGDELIIDVLKVSHHGSVKNTNDELVNLISCEDFIISANANTNHFHPDKKALCCILKNNGLENTKFYFTNDNSNLRKIFKNEKKVNVIFPEDIERGVCLTYEY